MIQTVEITIQNGTSVSLSALVVFPKNICYVNKNKYEITEEFKEELLDTICTWRHEYGSDDNIDSKEFTIKVTAQDGEERFHGKGIFPENFSVIEELLSDAYE